MADELITLKDVYTQVTMLVGHMQAVDTRNTLADQVQADHEMRLRSLEKWRYALPVSFVLALGSVGLGVVEVILYRH